jgi:hypothetical protein
MSNKYLEKIAAEWKEISEGLYYSPLEGGRYATNKATSEKFIKEHDRNHRLKGVGALGAFGLGVVPIIAGKELFRQPARTAKVALGMGAFGALAGLAAAHAGTKQVSRESKINKGIEKKVDEIGFVPY